MVNGMVCPLCGSELIVIGNMYVCSNNACCYTYPLDDRRIENESNDWNIEDVGSRIYREYDRYSRSSDNSSGNGTDAGNNQDAAVCAAAASDGDIGLIDTDGNIIDIVGSSSDSLGDAAGSLSESAGDALGAVAEGAAEVIGEAAGAIAEGAVEAIGDIIG